MPLGAYIEFDSGCDSRSVAQCDTLSDTVGPSGSGSNDEEHADTLYAYEERNDSAGNPEEHCDSDVASLGSSGSDTACNCSVDSNESSNRFARNVCRPRDTGSTDGATPHRPGTGSSRWCRHGIDAAIGCRYGNVATSGCSHDNVCENSSPMNIFSYTRRDTHESNAKNNVEKQRLSVRRLLPLPTTAYFRPNLERESATRTIENSCTFLLVN